MEWFKKLFRSKINKQCCCNFQTVADTIIMDDLTATRALNHIKNNADSYKITGTSTKHVISCVKNDCTIFLTRAIDYKTILKDEKKYCYFLDFYKGMEKLESWPITEQSNIEIVVSIFKKIHDDAESSKIQKIETFLKELEQ